MTRRSIVLALTLVATSAGAQSSTLTPSIGGATRDAIQRLADSARAAGLPVDPLYAKAAEGKLKDASDESILLAVRALAKRLAEARVSLGADFEEGALTAAAAALQSGVPMSALQRIARSSRVAGEDRRRLSANFAIAVVTLVDVARQRVSMDAALTSIESLLVHRAGDDQYARLRLAVEADVVAGQSPDGSIRARTEAIVRTLPRIPRDPLVPPPDPIR